MINENPEEFEERMKPIILKFMMGLQEQDDLWRNTYQEASDKWKLYLQEQNDMWRNIYQEANNQWELAIWERNQHIKTLEENLESKDQTLKILQERDATWIGRTPKTETKPRKGSVTSRESGHSGEKNKEEINIIKPDKKASFEKPNKKADVKVRKKDDKGYWLEFRATTNANWLEFRATITRSP